MSPLNRQSITDGDITVPDPWGLDGPLTARPEAQPDREALTLAAARCFRGGDGEVLLRHLRAITLGRVLGPASDDRALRHLEGQRQLFAHLAQLIDTGRRGPAPIATAGGDEFASS